MCIENKEYNDKLGILGDDTKCYHTAVFCDEFHLLIDKEFPNVIKWFYGFTKRIRKYKGRVVLITQNIKDMVSDDSSFQSQTTGIINSCQFLFIFKLLANDIANLDRK
ncbi:MAG: type IV secretory system conjugative DNA transfer family protein [Mycoplasmoidaceae bacterium]|nr:type IV secretory system conjugative DNA transfer family protein [Mycoplasmoidaceae bacterium]